MNSRPLTNAASVPTVGTGFAMQEGWGVSRTGKALVALAAAAIALVVMAWFDSTVLRDAVRQAQATFTSASVAPLFVLGSLLVAGAVLLLGALAWRAASLVVSLAYVVVGGFFVALWWVVWNLGSATNDAPPVLPEWFASALTSIWVSTTGQLNAVATIGAGMLIAGIAALVPWWRGRAAAFRADVAVPTAEAVLP